MLRNTRIGFGLRQKTQLVFTRPDIYYRQIEYLKPSDAQLPGQNAITQLDLLAPAAWFLQQN